MRNLIGVIAGVVLGMLVWHWWMKYPRRLQSWWTLPPAWPLGRQDPAFPPAASLPDKHVDKLAASILYTLLS